MEIFGSAGQERADADLFVLQSRMMMGGLVKVEFRDFFLGDEMYVLNISVS